MGRLEARRFKGEIRRTVELPYIALAPTVPCDERAPLLLFLHGAGECRAGAGVLTSLPALSHAQTASDFPFVLIAPVCQEDRWREDSLSFLVDHLLETHDVDEHRIYVTGFSLGAMGTWALAAHEPTRFAAIAPVSGPGIYRLGARRIGESGLATWVFHGERDEAVPVSEPERMVEIIEQFSSNIQYTVYPKEGHDVCHRVYRDQSLYHWLLSHRRV